MIQLKILCVGEEWRGSNASGLFYALSRAGACIQVVNELRYIHISTNDLLLKVLNFATRVRQVIDFNKHLLKASDSFRPDIVLIYKGSFILPDLLHSWKRSGIIVINFFPDVSFLAHGKYIPQCVPLYNHIFSTKTFAAKDLKNNFNYPEDQVTFIPHGFDPIVHRPLNVASSELSCDASFIGNYSRHKEEHLSYLLNNFDGNLNIWGGTWYQSRDRKLANAIKGVPVTGDLYAAAINSSRVNIALLSEQVIGASRGDQITSRTFHIPGAGGFMLHQRTDEVTQYFREEIEMACFSSKDEMVEKVQYYLKNEEARKRIALNGYERAVKDHSLDQRATRLLGILKVKFNLP